MSTCFSKPFLPCLDVVEAVAPSHTEALLYTVSTGASSALHPTHFSPYPTRVFYLTDANVGTLSMALPPNLVLHIHRVSDVQLEKRFIRKPPKLYVEIEIKTSDFIHRPKTKEIRDVNAQWEEAFVLNGIGNNQIARFYLKHAPTIGRDRTIGEAECTVSDLLPSSGTSYFQKDLKLYDTKGTGERRLIGTIVTSASYRGSQDEGQPSSEDAGEIPYEEGTQESLDDGIQDLPETTQDVTDDTADLLEEMQEPSVQMQEFSKDAAQHFLAEANTAVNERLGPDSLFERVRQLRDRLSKLSGIVSTIDKLAQLHPWVDLAWQVCSSLYKVVEKQYTTDEKIIDLVATIEATFGFIEDAEKIKEDAVPLRPIIEDLLKQVAECATFICTYLKPSFAKRATKGLLAESSTKIAEFTAQFIKLRESLMEKVQLHTGLVSSKVLGVVEELREFSAINVLKPSDMNAAHRPLCLHGTREGIMQTITDWVENVNDDEQNILWLHGLAGSGKSTIANTVSARFYELGRLGAFLFFERDKTDRDAVIHTMASQLADADPALRSKISAAIERDRRLVNRDIEKQFTHLIRGPLHDAAPSLLGPVVIVIDALDEYGDIKSRRSLLPLIAKEFTKLPNNFRFLITSRPESDIENVYWQHSNIKPISLTDMRDVIPEIRLYLSSELAHLRNVKRMPSDWPKEYNLDRAARMSEGLFIWASTLSRFLLGTNDPVETLESVLFRSDHVHAKGLDQLYATVLNARNDWHLGLGERFKAVATIVLRSKARFSDIDIDQLMGYLESKSCRGIFEDFHCLFDHSPGWPIRPLHASFGDYLTDVTRSGGKPWSLAGFDTNHQLVLCCFRVMSEQLRFNICNFETSGRLNKDYADLKERIEKHISPALRYASIYWWHHLKGIQTWQEDVGSALRTFSKEKLLFWLEVVSLVGNVHDTLRACDIAYTFVVDTDSELATLWTNLRMFIREYDRAISGSALHVYVSAHCPPFTKIHNWNPQPGTVTQLTHNHDIFPSALSCTAGCRHYLACSPDRLLLLSDCSFGSLWAQWKLLGDDGTAQLSAQFEKPYPEDLHCRPECITVSSDCRRVAGYFRDKGGISIWDVETGRVEIYGTMLKGSMDALAFHPLDSGQLAILSSRLISVWSIAEGIMCSIKIDHNAYQITWSPDGAYLASNGAVWSINRTTATITLQRAFSDLESYDLCFSPKTQSHILRAKSSELVLYDFKSNEQVFGPYTANNRSPITGFRKCTFSPDGSLIAALLTHTIQIFETESGKPYQDPIVAIVAPDGIDQVTFLPDGKQIAALVGGTVYTWELCHGSQVSDQERFDQANIQGHTKWITSISFSPDGTKFLSFSGDGTVHVRSSTDCMLLQEYWPMEYPQAVTAAVFSADNKTIYLALDDGTVQTSSGNVLYKPRERQSICNLYVYVSRLTFKEHIVFSPLESRKILMIPSNGDPEQDLHEISLEGSWYRFVVSSNGLIASFSSNLGTIEIVNLEGDHSSHPLLITKYTHLDTLFFSQKGDVLVSLGKDWVVSQDMTRPNYGINVWDPKSATCLRTFSLPGGPYSANPEALNANLLALTNDNLKRIIIYDIEKGTLVHTFTSWNSFYRLYIHGSKLISSYYGQITMWDLSARHTDGTTPRPDAAGTLPSIHSSSASPQWSIEISPRRGIEYEDYQPTGWVLGSNSGGRLLWVPKEIWCYLDPPGSTYVIGHRRMKLLDFIPDMDRLKNYEGVGRLSMK
ncbi:hypothetical protein QCA50_012475 [Cerrena zonata]|uniref:C2 domain-containing protein n=1 Tax=Cerrena zonata TaxID=2478898 RepID=A0AAW0G3L2_9APHY